MQSTRRATALLLAWLTAAQPVYAQSAVELANAPLGSRTQAIPNLIFGIDDSGSTDDEVLLRTNDGALWYNTSSKNFWNSSTGALNTNDSRSGHSEYDYLFPNGSSTSSTSDLRRYGDSTVSYAIPPIKTFAWLRSTEFNPIYYNPAIRYTPWPQAYIAGAVRTFSNASSTAARSHPWFPTSGTATTFNLTANVTSTSADWTFKFLPGMVIPGNVSAQRKCSGSSTWTNVTADYTVPSGSSCDVNVPYYPATYWTRNTSCNTTAADCTTTPTGVKIQRTEIRSTTATYPRASTRTDCVASSSTCSYAEEIQNFANWFQYYRKRRLMMAAGLGQSLTSVRGIRGGAAMFNNRSSSNITMYDFSSSTAATSGQVVMGMAYSADAQSGTPTRDMLKYIGTQYQRTTTDAYGIAPPIQYGCQRNNAFIVTDGYNTDTSTTAPSYTRSTYVGTAPYTAITTNSIADIAGALYTNNPRSDLPTGLLSIDPTYAGNNPDRNTNLHVNTFAVTVGAIGTIYGTSSTSYTNPFVNPPTWPSVSSSSTPAQIDDLWHATINGRGAMYTARNASELTTNINTIVRNMLVSSGSDAGIAVSSVNIRAGNNTAYVSSYNAQDWSGQLCAYSVNTTDGSIDTAAGRETWCARDPLNSLATSSRKIATFDGSSGVKFATGGGGLSSTLVSGLALSSTDGANVLAYLRGDRTNEGTTYRTRSAVLGDITSAEPVLDNGVVYQPANDGLLHAFDSSTGAELWAYMPYNLLGTIKELARTTYTHQYFNDGTPVIQDITTRKILVGHLRGGGAGFYAIDITDPRPNSENTLANKVLWEFPNASTSSTVRNQIGTSYGKPQVVKLADGTWAVLVTSGYNNASGQNHLHVLNAETGAVIRTITTSTGTGLAQISAWVANPTTNPTVDHVYGGDLSGNLWRFDLRSTASADWNAVLIANFNISGTAQPITSAPELVTVSSRRLVVVATGRMLGSGDLTVTATQSVYGVVDNMSSTPTITTPRSSLRQQTLTTGSGGLRTLTSNAIDWSVYSGWFFDLPAGERVNTDPTLAFGVLTFTSNMPSPTACASQSFLYAVNVESGGQMPSTSFRTGSPWAGRQLGYTYASRPVVVTLPSGRVVAITHKSDASINSSELPVTATSALRKVAWREVFR